MPRPQFTVRALLVAMLVVGAFLGGIALQQRLDEPARWQNSARMDEDGGFTLSETMKSRDGTLWHRSWKESAQEARKRMDLQRQQRHDAFLARAKARGMTEIELLLDPDEQVWEHIHRFD